MVLQMKVKWNYLKFDADIDYFDVIVTIFEKQRKWAKKYSPLYVILAFPYCFVNCTRPEEVEVSTDVYKKNQNR